nr:type I polyketide synthase [Tumebacillus amylolyticus]
MEIAVIGMSGKFPGANTLEGFWENLKQGVDSISRFSDEELIEAGVAPELIKRSNYVKAKGIVEDVEYFDAPFFSYSPREAEITDPQIRILQETTWEALEMAGYDPQAYNGLIGLYVGAATNFHWMEQSPLMKSTSAAEFSEAGTLCYKDAISTLTSYKLGLKGPSFTLYTACSTSLLGIHLACRSLLVGDCNMAVAGGVSVSYPKKKGYLYEPGMTSSPDGHVRAFDADAQGAVFSDGVGIVVLKRLEDALADGDTIHAVIKGTAANNDGGRKVGYTAPSVEGQADVIQAAHSFAEVEPESIAYIETHGTATPLGDTIEFEALKRAFSETEEKGFCAIGSVKSNVGHLDTAAGVTGFIKTILSLQNKAIPPTLHIQRPNPKIDVVDSPFYLSRELTDWETNGLYPRRAGVSAFGFGGTNVHVVLEEAPEGKSDLSTRNSHLLVLSARSETALVQAAENLALHLENHPHVELADVAYTLQVGRRNFAVRKMLMVQDVRDAQEQLRDVRNFTTVKQDSRDVLFLLPDHPQQAMRLAVEIASQDAEFREALEQVLEIAAHFSQAPLQEALLSGECSSVTADLLLVAIGFALSNRLAEGLEPAGLIGFGIAEYAAAAAAGVCTLEDAFALVTGRQEADFERRVRRVLFEQPQVPFLSSVTGTWITDLQATDPLYWVEQAGMNLRQEEVLHDMLSRADGVVLSMQDSQFRAGAATLVQLGASPLQALGTLWEQGVSVDWSQLYQEERRLRIPLPTYPFEKQRYWLDPETRETEKKRSGVLDKLPNLADWFYEPVWEPKPLTQTVTSDPQTWLLLADDAGIGEALQARLQALGHRGILVRNGSSFLQHSADSYTVNALVAEEYDVLLRSLKVKGHVPDQIVHLWNVSPEDEELAFLDSGFYSLLHLAKAISANHLIHALDITVVTNQMQNVTGEEQISPEKQTLLAPVKVLPQEYPNIRCRSVDVELNELDSTVAHLIAELQCEITDTVVAYRGKDRLISTFRQLPAHQITEGLNLAPNEAAPRLRERGVYLITGGLGGVGLKLADYLARSVQAKLVLIGRTGLPPRSEWESYLNTHDEGDSLASRIRSVQKLEQLGAEVLVLGADVADEQQMQHAIETAQATFGPLHGVVHAAGVLRVRSAQCVMAAITKEECEEQFRPKLQGMRVLEKLLIDRELDFCFFVSSLSPILGGLGFVAYAGANLYLDGMADKLSRRTNNRWMSINWGDWQYTGQAFEKPMLGETLEVLEMTTEEGIKTFQCVLATSNLPRVIISSGDMNARYEQWVTLESRGERRNSKAESTAAARGRKQPQATLYGTPQAEQEAMILEIWKDFYRVSSVDVNDNFFDLGATSLDIIQIHAKLVKRLEKHVPIDAMFAYPSIRSLAGHLSGGQPQEIVPALERQRSIGSVTGDIAIIGMAGRFPGAQDIEAYWENLTAGIESIRFFTDEELLEAGVPEGDVKNPNYVKAKGYLEGTDLFDAAFFDYTPRDASLMDPQLRVFHECAWTALEHAGYDGEAYPGLVGVYGGASPNLYWQVLSTLSESSEPAGQFLISLLNDKDSLTTQVSYKFNLKGPSANVFTGCSTSLVAIHSASQALLNGHCDLALAGGITLSLPDKAGYIYQEGMLFSADGHCKSFDEKANGMLFGDGVGIVVLKRLDDALADGDTIHAVIKGSAINNDGNRKIGYTAPSVDGQTEVIRMAQQAAGISPDSVSYIETHGTATKLGDTIEIKALRQVFDPEKKQTVPIGSVKSNIGHLNAASGVAGLIKTVLSMQHEQIPPSLNFTEPNKSIDFENSPFFVNTELREWKRVEGLRRAGVSSFGIGGTNAHIVLEEAPQMVPTSESRPHQMLMLSAKSPAALERMTANLATHLLQHPDVNLADAAYTLQAGRRAFKHRRALLASTAAEAVEKLTNPESRHVYSWHAVGGQPKTVFLFAGNGSQYVNMGRDLYENEPVFRQVMDECFTILRGLVGFDMKEILYPSDDQMEEAKQKLAKMEACQPLILSFEYALANLLMQWGVQPSALIGYSFGEYVAACLADVFTLEDALHLIVTRGRLMSSLPAGAMLSVPLGEIEIRELMDTYLQESGAQLSLSIVNGPSCIIAGSDEAIAGFEAILRSKRLMCMRVTIEGAAHSHLLDPILEEFATHVQRIALQAPSIPYISCITGTWVTAEQVTDPNYWVRHMRETVRFADGIQELKKDPACLFVEIGPGRDLSVMVQRFLEPGDAAARLLNTIRPQQQDLSDLQYLLTQTARLWTLGVELDWQEFYKNETRRRIPMPTYSFEPVSYKPQGNPFDLGSRLASQPKSSGKKAKLDEWFYAPRWSTTLTPVTQPQEGERWLIFADPCGLGAALATELQQRGEDVTVVYAGDGFSEQGDRSYTINPRESNDYRLLLQKAGLPTRILHLFSVTEAARDFTPEFAARMQEIGFYSLFSLAQALSGLQVGGEIAIRVITNGVQRVTGDETLIPEKATTLGASLVLPQEYSYLTCSNIDVLLPRAGSRQEKRLLEHLIEEARANTSDKTIAYRGLTRFVQSYAPISLQRPEPAELPLKQGGVYLITGGTGGIGRILAEHLAQNFQAKLVLTSRRGLPENDPWIEKLESLGANVSVMAADVADRVRMAEVIADTEARFGPLNGVIHGAGVIGGDTFNLIKELTPADCEAHFQPKMYGLLAMEDVLRGKPLDFCLLMSSISAVLGGLGYIAYAASNLYMDAFVANHNLEADVPWISVNWSDWKYWEDGEKESQIGASVHELSMSPEEGVDAFHRALAWQQGDVLVHSPGDLQARIDQWVNLQSLRAEEDDQQEDLSTYHARPMLLNDYLSPRNEREEKLARIWQRIFRVEQIGVRDEFLELGGDSLKAITVVSRIHKEFNVEVPVGELFNLSNIEKLSAYIAEADSSEYDAIPTAPHKPYYELSSAQKRFYILHRLNPESTAYNDTSVVLLQGKVDKTRLEDSFRRLVAHHEIFRTTLEMVGDEPKQKIHANVELTVEHFDATQEETLELITNFVRPFDFAVPPYLRIALIRLAAEEHVLVIDLHHIVTDGVSYDIFVRDFLTLYSGEELAPLRIQYKDYTEWQNSDQEREAVSRHEAYWLERFQGEIPVLELPTDFPRPQTPDAVGRTLTFTLDASLTAKIREIAAREETTLYTVLLAAYTVLLSKYSGQDDIVIGSPITGRPHVDLQNIIGVFVNMLAMRNRPQAHKSFREFLNEVRVDSLSAYDHQKYQYETLVQTLGLQGNLSRNPLFDVAFVQQHMDTEALEVDGLRVTPYDYDHKRAQFDLLLRAVETPDSIELTMEYAAALFKRETVEKMCERFREVLERVTNDVNLSLGNLHFQHDLQELQAVALPDDLGDFEF